VSSGAGTRASGIIVDAAATNLAGLHVVVPYTYY
jgi:hypothetical protein